MNQTIKNILAKMIQEHKDEWDFYLPSALFAVRTSQQASTRMTPFMLTYGREAVGPQDRVIGRNEEMTEEEQLNYRIKREIENVEDIRNQAKEFISKAQTRQRRNHDHGHKEIIPLSTGDKVLLYRDVIVTSWSAKLEPKWEGPYYVHSIKGTTFQLKKITGDLLPFKVHRNQLKKYHDAQVHH
jgi:hypothetical protein